MSSSTVPVGVGLKSRQVEYAPLNWSHNQVHRETELFPGKQRSLCTWRAEAAVGTVAITQVAGLGVGTGVRTGAATFLVHHVVGT